MTGLRRWSSSAADATDASGYKRGNLLQRCETHGHRSNRILGNIAIIANKSKNVPVSN